MMNGSDNNVDLGLSLGYSNNTIKTRLNNSPGAGVNAGSKVDMTFAASDPLSELVWSPQKGLSLRCADCSKADKTKPFLLWNVGPSNKVPPPSQSTIYKEADDDKIVDGNLVLSNRPVCFDSEPAQGASLAQSPQYSIRHMIGPSNGPNNESSDKIIERNLEERAPIGDDENKEVCNHQIVQMADMANGSQDKTGHPNPNFLVQGSNDSNFDTAVSKPLSGKLHKEIPSSCNDIASAAAFGDQILAGVTMASEHHNEIESGACIPPLPTSQSQDGLMKEAAEEERKSKNKTNGSKLPPLEKLESIAENDLRHRMSYWQSDERLLRGSPAPLEITRINGNQRRGKNKALSDGNFCARFSNDEDDSNESVESCNTFGFLSRGKRGLRFVESIIVDNKRIKRQIDGSNASTSIVRNDSSFMNWISNMVKGFPKCDQEETPSLALTLAHSSDRCAKILQETIVSRVHNDYVYRNMGFQTIFQSLYSPSTKLSEARVARDDCSVEEARVLVQADKTNVGNSQISCREQNDVSNHNFMSNDKSIPSIPDVMGQSGKQCLLTASIPVQEYCGVDWGENRLSSKPKCYEDRGVRSFGSLGKQTVENESPLLVSDSRAIYTVSNSNKGNLFGSLWITRLSPKAAITSLSLVQSKRISCEDFERPAVCRTLDPPSQMSPDFAIEQKISEGKDSSGENTGGLLGKELQVFASKTQSSAAFKEIRKLNNQKEGVKINPILDSEKFKSSEAMASVFARRLDALKHRKPSGSEDGATSMAATCFFCGKSDHTLQDCSEVSETKLECLLRNVSSYEGADDCSCLCIRCLRHDHWAVTCPTWSSSREQHQGIGNLKLCQSNERNFCFPLKEDHPKGAVSGKGKTFTVTDLRIPTMDAELLGGRSSSPVETQKHLISNSRENRLTEYPKLSAFVNTQILEEPKGMFDSVRRLQVSRADILRLMKSQVFMSHIEGFFLRLRLGKREAGFSESGYSVACIAGKPVKDSKKSIAVNVGGVNCLVGSQYVSNDDFLEDELTAWWCRTLRSGGKLPSKEDLESKFEQRIKFGF